MVFPTRNFTTRTVAATPPTTLPATAVAYRTTMESETTPVMGRADDRISNNFPSCKDPKSPNRGPGWKNVLVQSKTNQNKRWRGRWSGKNKVNKVYDKNSTCNEWSILYSNIRGFSSKALSLNSIAASLKSNLNRTDKNGGGVSSSVSDEDSKYTLKTTEGKGETEYLITRHDQFCTPINVINFYGKQECRAKKEAINEDWNSVLEEIAEIEARDELLIIMSDMNMLLGNYIKGSVNNKINHGG